MTPRVRLKVRELGESFDASRIATLVRLVTGVRPDVLLEMGQLSELSLTDLTTVWLDAQMDPRVLR